MSQMQILGYQNQPSVIERLNASAKLLFLLVVSVAAMTTYDTRLLFVIGAVSLYGFHLAHLKWRQYSFVALFIISFAALNVVLVYLFAPQYGEQLYHSRHVLFGSGYLTVTAEELFYLANLALKYCCTVPLALLFLLTTNPSLFAASLNKLKVSYKISYAVALALRYIPDIQSDFKTIANANAARGVEMSNKANVWARLKATSHIIMPLIFNSLARIDTISTAMELRRFGRKPTRTWYHTAKFHRNDWLLLVLGGVFAAAAIALFYVNGGRFYNPFR